MNHPRSVRCFYFFQYHVLLSLCAKLKILHRNPKTKCTLGSGIIGTGFEETAIRDKERMKKQ